jgi:predicted  nucleic acid-binding Zn-ribbon protein
MGWLIAFFFAITTSLLALVLFIHWDARRTLGGQLKAASEKLQALEAQEADVARLRRERDSLAQSFLLLRGHAKDLEHAEAEKQRVMAEAKAYAEKFNAQAAEAKVKFQERQTRLDEELKRLTEEVAVMRQEHQALTDEMNLRHLGFYEARYSFTTSLAYKAALDENLAKQQAMIKAKQAAICSRDLALVQASAAARGQVDKFLSLMLRAFNGDCDSAIANVRANNFTVIENRINRAFTAINKLGVPQGCTITDRFKALKIDELRLTHEHALKVQAEREEQRELRERMREEAIVAREQEKADREAEEAAEQERLYQEALERARQEVAAATGEQQAELEAKMRELERQVAEAHAKTERAISEAQLTRVGHVYVISNIGAFGEDIYKIGMTRRRQPEDRVSELSGAAVPFDFDIHALIRTEDAPALEAELHRRFADRRVNIVNERKEFFHVTIDEIAEVVRERCGDIELTLVAEAAEFYQSEAYRKARQMPLLSQRTLVASLAEEIT